MGVLNHMQKHPVEVNGVKIQIHTFELWKQAEKEDEPILVAGDLGYSIGGVYTSLSGFSEIYDIPGIGFFQMKLTAAILQKKGFAFWDLGMGREYKQKLHGVMTPR